MAQPTPPRTPSPLDHRKRTSWHSLTSPRASLDRRSPLGLEPLQDVDLDDAFDDGDDITLPPVNISQNALKRESIGATFDPKQVLGDDWRGLDREEALNGNGDDAVPADEEVKLEGAMVDISLNDKPILSVEADMEDLPKPPAIVYENEIVSPGSPSTPSIVVSRPGSPEDDDQPSFVEVSLSPNNPVRAPVPKRIVVPSRSMSPNVQVVQGPPSPMPMRGAPSPLGRTSSTNSPSMSQDGRQPSLATSVSGPLSGRVQSPVMPTPAGDGTRPRRSTGVSTQDVVSKTRPSHLPPKTKEEDKKHMKSWEEMMQKSRLHDEQRKQKLVERRLAREQAVEDSLERWEKEVMPDVKAALRDPKLRRLWWDGIPTKLRGRIWYTTLGNALALSKDAYRSCLSRAKRAISSNSFPSDVMHQIEEDVRSTLPALHLFHPETGPMYQDLKDLLCAWVVARADEGLSYVRGASTVGAMFLINMPPEQAFVAMRNMLERHCLRSFYGGPGAKEDVEAYYRIFDTLLADVMPKVYFNFKQHGISPSLYLPDWLITIFLQHLPFEACSRIWDVLVLEGDSFLLRTSIAILGVLESRLFFPDRKELLEVLHGENKAALEVARRVESTIVDLGARYEQYGMTEEALWERLDQTEWKDSTWSRLIQRELPDI